MEGINLFIVDDNKSMVTVLKLHLQNMFGLGINISTFCDGESCLEKVDKHTEIVILDYLLEGKNGIEILRSIKKINPKTEVIMLSGNNDILLVIESFTSGAIEYVVKGPSSWRKITSLVEQIVTEPTRKLIKEFRLS
ncbi:MAG: response regulator [Bacteroidia bacterium]